jgi:hypothetical protein
MFRHGFNELNGFQSAKSLKSMAHHLAFSPIHAEGV